MVVTDLTGLINPGMQLTRQQQAVPQFEQSAADAARALEYQRAEADLRASYAELERANTDYNQLVESYNTAESEAERALLESMINARADEYNAAIRRYNDTGNRYQDAGVITGFTALNEFTPQKTELKPTISALPQQGPMQGVGVEIPQTSGEGMSIFDAARVAQAAITRAGMEKSQELFQETPGAVKRVIDFAQTPANASPEEQAALKEQRMDVVENILGKISIAPDNAVTAAADIITGKTDAQLVEDQRQYMTGLGNAQIALGASLGQVVPQVGQIFMDSGKEIFVSRDFQTEGLINMETGEINRPSVYDTALFGAALGATGAAVGTGAVTGVSGFGNIFSRAAPLAIEGDAVASGFGGGSAGQALANVAAAENTAKTALAGASALGISLSDVDYGIGDILNQYPRRDEERSVNNPMPGEAGIGRGVLDEYPSRDKYGSGNRYNRNNQNREQNWNRSELDYRGSVGSGYSTRLVEDSVLRTRNQEANRNRYRNEFDYLYEYATVAEVAPRVRRSVSFAEEDSVIAPSRKKGKGRKKHFTERLIL